MKKFFCLICYTIVSVSVFSKAQYFDFVDPLPGAKYINKETTIIIKPGKDINLNSFLSEKAVGITGSITGACSYSVIRSTDGETIILKPVHDFEFGETVTVEFTQQIKTARGSSIKPYAYSFTISSSKIKINQQTSLLSELSDDEISRLANGYYNFDLIGEFPKITINYYNNPSQGRFFLANFPFSPTVSNTPYLMIINNDGQAYYKKQMPVPCFDFNMQPNGHLTYFDLRFSKYFEMDENYSIIDSFYTGNGYKTDLHELRLLSNRHALLMSYDSQMVDMSRIIPGGTTNAVVSGLIIQEIDAEKNVVFQWRSWDHMLITDAWHENLLAPNIDAVHGNAIELDLDGNILISSRHLDEITKIDRSTGDMIWRLGGKNNQFHFTNDPLQFTYQHAIRRLPNGNITLFDNGNYHTPPFSRGVEYKLDEVNKTATLVWEYRHKPANVWGFAMGFCQRLDNGNTLISWGSINSPAITEVHPDGTKAHELSLPFGIYSYRGFKYKYREDGTGNIMPGSMYLAQNYPNPFNPTTSIKYGVPRINGSSAPVDVRLAVYDVLGREIAVLVDRLLEPDSYQVDFDASGLTSGVYFYTMLASGGNARYYETKKMIVIK